MLKKIGYQGEPGAFSEQAVRELLHDGEPVGFTTFDDLVEAVAAGHVDAGLLPVENSIFGPIARSYDLLWQYPALSIIDETSLHVVQTLMGIPGSTIGNIREVRSHPVALEQCRRFFSQYPHWTRKIVDDTAGAVREIIAGNDPTIAAVGSRLAASVYGAEIIETDVQDNPHNYTRFFLIATSAQPRRNLGRACVALAFTSKVGSLRDALSILADAELNLRSLVSRPSGEGPFQYRFYCEIENGDRKRIDRALTQIEGDHRLLGIY